MCLGEEKRGAILSSDPIATTQPCRGIEQFIENLAPRAQHVNVTVISRMSF